MADSTNALLYRVRSPLAEADYVPLADGSFWITRLQPLDGEADPIAVLQATLTSIADHFALHAA